MNNKSFFSRRNHVMYNKESNMINKQFIEKNNYDYEKKYYNLLHNHGFMAIPKLLDEDDEHRILYLEYLEGMTVLEQMEVFETDYNISEGVSLITMTLEWLDTFHQVFKEDKSANTGICMKDINLRNFIFFKGKIYGIDFENCDIGIYNEEKTELLARYMLYDPVETQYKQNVVNQVIAKLCVDERILNRLKELINKNLINIKTDRINRHRNKPIYRA